MGDLYLGGLLDTMPGTSFWLLHVGLMTISTALLIATHLFFGQFAAPSYEEPAAAAA